MSLLPAKTVTPDNLLHEVAVLRQQGYRLVTLTCLDQGTGHTVYYHFDKAYQPLHLRLEIPDGQELCSVSSLYPAAMIVENEIKDHFGVKFTGLALDFQGRLMLTEAAPKTPMNRFRRCGMELDARQPAAASPAAA
ncbi:MAG: NADH-quinone oxidoreductase subunit C [Verrucomicrobia bacterium]|jgi:ech hydrogenase subunit D|nr:NADH-quinone oxidoreductase subunit C [Verrucomicrobiota bacterium]